MTMPRVRLAARIAAVEAFREERERQQLAVARHTAHTADVEAERAEQTWRDVEAGRAEALVVRHDVARYLMWCDLAGQASGVHEHASREASLAQATADEHARQWAAAKARADATADRAERMSIEAAVEVEKRQEVERMDLWLSRQERPA